MKFKFGDRVKITLPFYEKANCVVIDVYEETGNVYIVQLMDAAKRIIEPVQRNFKEEDLSSLEGNK